MERSGMFSSPSFFSHSLSFSISIFFFLPPLSVFFLNAHLRQGDGTKCEEGNVVPLLWYKVTTGLHSMRSRRRRRKQMKGNIVHFFFLLHDLTIIGRRDGEKETNDADLLLLSESSSILSLLSKSSSIPFNQFERIQIDGTKTERNTLFTFSVSSSRFFNFSLSPQEISSHFFFLNLYSDTRIGSQRLSTHSTICWRVE